MIASERGTYQVLLNSFSVWKSAKRGMRMPISLTDVKNPQLAVSVPVGAFPLCLLLEEHWFPMLQNNCSGVVSSVTLSSPGTSKQVG